MLKIFERHRGSLAALATSCSHKSKIPRAEEHAARLAMFIDPEHVVCRSDVICHIGRRSKVKIWSLAVVLLIVRAEFGR